MIKKRHTIFMIIISLLCIKIANASTYTNAYDITGDSTNTNVLLDLAENQIENFNTLNFIIARVGEYDYYLIAFKESTTNGNNITAENTEIIRYYRSQTGNYNYIWNISKSNETTTTINCSNIVLSNIKGINSSISRRYEETKERKNIRIILMFILGILFAILLRRNRN